jgi:integrase
MPKNLTDVSIRNLKPGPTRREVPDGGARGLYLVLQPSGAKSFAVRYRLNGKPQKLTLGRWQPPEDRKEAANPQVGDAVSLAAARKLASDAMLKVGRGRDPAGEKREHKEERRAAEANTFQAIAEEYLKRVCGMRVDAKGNVTFDRSMKRTGRERDLMLRRAIYPVIGNRPMTEIRRKEVVHLFDRIEDRSGPVAADRALALLSVIMTWHAKRDDAFVVPLVKGMARTKPRERARDRVLADHELRAVWKVAENQGVFGRLVRFILLTSARRTEAAGMLWSEINGSDWTLPASRNKTKLDLARPLSAAALAALPERVGSYVFTNDGKNQIAGYSKFKKRFDAAVLAELRKEDPKAEPFENWTLHDLRRTARTLLSRAGVNADHAERCLGHVVAGVRGVYDRHEFYDEKKKAYEALAALIQRIASPAADNVVQFSTRATSESD